MLGVGAVGAMSATTAAAKPARKARADSGVVYFGITHSANGNQYAAGSTTDKLFGSGAITFVIQTTRTPSGGFRMISKPVTLFFSNGTLTGTATATVTPAPGGTSLTGGKLKAAHGTAAQKGHSVSATFQGTGNPVTGAYKIIYTGVYK
jgi:hypothetical protein